MALYIFAILCVVSRLAGAITYHKSCVTLDGQTININYESDRDSIFLSDLRRQLVDQRLISIDSNKWYFEKRNGRKIEIEDEIDQAHSSEKCAVMINSKDRQLKLCKLSEQQQAHCTFVNVDTSTGDLKVETFRDNLYPALSQDPPCIDWRFVKNINLDSSFKESLHIHDLLRLDDEITTQLENIIFPGDIVYVVNHFHIDKIDFSVNIGIDIYNIRLNPYITLEQFRKISNGTKTCHGMEKNEFLSYKTGEKWRALNRKLVWYQKGAVLDALHKTDPDIVFDIGIEATTAIDHLLYTAKDNKKYIDYQNVLSNHASFIGIKTDWIANDEGTILMRAVKRNKSDPEIDPINLSNLKSITEKQVRYTNNLVVAENNTNVRIEFQIPGAQGKSLVALKQINSGYKINSYVVGGKRSSFEHFTNGEHIIFTTAEPTVIDRNGEMDKIQFQIIIRPYIPKKIGSSRTAEHDQNLPDPIRISSKDVNVGNMTAHSELKDFVDHTKRFNGSGYTLGDPKTLTFSVLIFKDRQTANRILNVIPQKTHSGDES